MRALTPARSSRGTSICRSRGATSGTFGGAPSQTSASATGAPASKKRTVSKAPKAHFTIDSVSSARSASLPRPPTMKTMRWPFCTAEPTRP